MTNPNRRGWWCEYNDHHVIANYDNRGDSNANLDYLAGERKWGTLYVFLSRSGTRTVKWRCPACTYTEAIGFGILRSVGIEPYDLPVNDDRRPADQRCSYWECDNLGIEFHHWAPRSIFGLGEADNWPKSALCQLHHREWHRIMNEWRMTKLSQMDEVYEDDELAVIFDD